MSNDFDLPSNPAEAAILASGLRVEAREMPQLIRRVLRRLPADADTIRAELVAVRRKFWAKAAMEMASRAGQPWVRRADAEAAAKRLQDPEATPRALRMALDDAVAERLRDVADNAESALEIIAGEQAEEGHPLSGERMAALAQAVAEAHGLSTAATAEFVLRAGRTAERRQQDLRSAEKAAREKRREEVTRLRAWEKSLIGIEGVPKLLHCSEREALRWVGAGLIPVARKIRSAKGGRELWQFDPAEIVPLRRELQAWRAAEQMARPERARAPDQQRPTQIGRAAALAGRGSKEANQAVARAAALDRYAAHFATARAMIRRITIITGPTNSGKSHMALDRLAAAESGMALAPLRLLAHEFREALAARGVQASLATGEERMPVHGSRHLAATVEMCPFHNPVDVALIDEAQLLHDRDRGAAWTAAIMGVPARQVFVLGAPECIPMVKRIAALCGDEVEEISLERKSPLHAASRSIGFGELRAGDALIAFSRRDVMDLREQLVKRGRKVAVVYGALSPEVRRAEAARFRNGEADIVVATDAIGMGLNLPIRRVIFSTLRKFDGEERRELNSQEVKQIGGRAGRFGHHEGGIVAVLAGGGEPGFIQAMMDAPPAPPAELRPQVQPDAEIIAAVAAEIGSDSLFGVLARIQRAVLRKDDPNYRLADMTQALAIASAIDGVAGLSLMDRWTYALCPVDERDNGITRLAQWAVEHGAGRPVRPPLAGRLPPPDRASGEELQRAEKIHKRLVAWRWMALRFAAAYPDFTEAEAETDRLDSWIEDVLRQQRRTKAATRAA
ncbi:DEAD/DEAH box helicase [Teichococcus oryzae]|uniref:RNA helicase n=1 Tax=Teichococcus oryzae TaxID=1608942 RepID=A0A5B2TBF7_9PROT|nr:helicase-related protein [Pseudoroseomonas oryzae]KAA2211826.1 RNA helicase [Pseudoroseomonas oryzae]